MLIDIHLGHNAEYKLTYELFDHRVSERIWQRFQTNNFEMISRTQFYNFGETVESVQQRLSESVEKIKALLPGQFVDADDLNTLHINFPDLVKDATGELRHVLSMFNYHLHHLEDISRYQNKRFLFSHQDPGEPLEENDYKLFSPTRLKNYLYMNYPHVGKHILELYYDQDYNIPSSHIVPTSLLKNDCVAWFANDQYADPTQILKTIKRWLIPMANKLPYAIDDPKLAVGHIALGKVLGEPDLDKIANNCYIYSVEAR
jgi:hypothetical protein